MKKILSAALALVCVWFATPSFANCNLFDISTARTLYRNGSVSETKTTTGYSLSGSTTAANFIIVDFGKVSELEGEQFSLSYKHTAYNSSSIAFVYTDADGGNRRDTSGSSILVSAADAAGRTNVSLKILTPDTVGTHIFNFEEIQIERGSTATPYQPYNPLCETCDGTIVNYVSATGTGVQNGTPTPDNPIEPTFYKQGNMVLRKVGDYADSYDASTGKITRRVGVKVLDGSEAWGSHNNIIGWFQLIDPIFPGDSASDALSTHYLQYSHHPSDMHNQDILFGKQDGTLGRVVIRDAINFPELGSVSQFKSWLAQQYQAGTPVTVYYPLATETTEDWPASYCETPIKIATTKYNETAFSPLNTALQNAISVVDSVVTQTITQAGRIADLQAQKQTRPNDIADDNEKCPAGKKCLLVEDASGVPHWYEIVENAWDLPAGYTQLEYIESTGTQWINTGVTPAQLSRNSTEIFIDGQYTGLYAANFAALFGTQGSSVWFKSDIKNNTSIGVQMGEPNTETVVNVGNALSRVKININTQNNLCYVNNSSYALHISNSAFSLSGQITLFKSNGVANDQYAKAKIYSMYIKNNGAHVRNFIPVKQNSDGAIGMYDTVEGRFYENAGDGEFIAGAPVSE